MVDLPRAITSKEALTGEDGVNRCKFLHNLSPAVREPVCEIRDTEARKEAAILSWNGGVEMHIKLKLHSARLKRPDYIA